MRILVVSDVHANPWALRAVEQDAGQWDHLLFLGDAVNYGPDPKGAVAWLRDHQAIGVRGNHDHAVATGADPQASPAKQPLALAMRDWTRAQLGVSEFDWLNRLPTTVAMEIAGTRFALVHATPRHPLYDYRVVPQAGDQLLQEITGQVRADVLLLGHTHLPFLRRFGSVDIANPGSVGQPLDGNPQAAYALWEDGRLALRRAAYDREEPIRALRALPLEPSRVDALVSILQTARTGG